MITGKFKQIFFGLFIGLIGVVANLTPAGPALEEKFGLYWLFQLRGPVTAPDDVVVISIDQPSANQFDLPLNPRFWPRDLHARLIDKIASAGARAIVFDLLFEAPSDNPESDEMLAQAMRKAHNVVAAVRLDVEETPLFTSHIDSQQYDVLTTSTIPLLPIIENAAMAQAPFPLPRTTSVTAYWTFKPSAGDSPTLPFVALQAYAMPIYDDFVRLLMNVNPAYEAQLPTNKETLDVQDLIFTLRHLFMKDPRLALQIQAELRRDTSLNHQKKKLVMSLINLYSGNNMRYLNFYGPPRSVRTIPYHQVLPHPDNNDTTSSYPDLHGKAVFVGFSAATQPEQDRIRDDYQTVFSNPDGLTISGVEIAATAFANLLEDKPIRLLPYIGNLGLLFLFGFILGIVFIGLPNRNAAIVGVVLISIYVGYANFQFKETGTWLPLFIPLFLQMPLAIFGSLSLRYYIAKCERKQIEEEFGRFLPERIVRHIKKNASQTTPNNQLVYGVCLATDIENYTTISEKMSPAKLSQLMNDYYAALFEPIEKYSGDVSDVVGDAMLALWTAPSANLLDLRKKACLAGLEIAAAIERFNHTDNRPKLITRIGLHFGEIMLGSVGASRHFEYRAVGDVVNTTNRIQGANKKLGTRLLVANEVVEGLNDFLIRPLGKFLLVGKSAPIGLTELITHKQPASHEQFLLCEMFASALRAYHLQQWQQASDIFSEILKVFPEDGPARFFLVHCQQPKPGSPASSWHPVIRLTEK